MPEAANESNDDAAISKDLLEMEVPLRNAVARLEFVTDAIAGPDADDGLLLVLCDVLDDAARALELWRSAMRAQGA